MPRVAASCLHELAPHHPIDRIAVAQIPDESTIATRRIRIRDIKRIIYVPEVPPFLVNQSRPGIRENRAWVLLERPHAVADIALGPQIVISCPHEVLARRATEHGVEVVPLAPVRPGEE